MNKFFTILLLLPCIVVFSQVGGVAINANGNPPAASAVLDLSSTAKGFLMPRLTQGQQDSISNPDLGLLIYNTTANCIEMYGFGNWQTISCLCNGAPSTPGAITGNNNPCANATNITYSVGLILGANTYTWTVPSGATIIAGQGTNSITVNFGTTPGNISVTANNSCGSSSPNALPVTINTLPGTPGNITGNPYPCANSTAQAYSIPADSGATSYMWSVPSGSIVTAGQGTASILVNFYSTPGNLAVTASNVCGASSAGVLPISMAITPSTPDTITGPAVFSTNQSGVVYSIAPVTEAATYTWTVPVDASITVGQGTDSATVAFVNGYGNICVAAGNCAGTSNSYCRAVYNSCYTSGSKTFTYTGGQQTFTAPCGISFVTITAYGAQGGNVNGNLGGLGGSATGNFSLTPGALLYVNAGAQPGGNGGGFNGGGNGYNNGTGGGGASDVRAGGTALSNRVIVAGGGGGTTYSWSCAGGTGGGETGGTGNSSNGGSYDGQGGTQNEGGAESLTFCGGAGAGSLGQGGNASSCDNDGGGGGGGYYGGGGSDAGGAGGGSGYIGGVANGSMQNGAQGGNGQVVISW